MPTKPNPKTKPQPKAKPKTKTKTEAVQQPNLKLYFLAKDLIDKMICTYHDMMVENSKLEQLKKEQGSLIYFKNFSFPIRARISKLRATQRKNYLKLATIMASITANFDREYKL